MNYYLFYQVISGLKTSNNVRNFLLNKISKGVLFMDACTVYLVDELVLDIALPQNRIKKILIY